MTTTQTILAVAAVGVLAGLAIILMRRAIDSRNRRVVQHRMRREIQTLKDWRKL